MDKNEIVYNML